MKFTFPDKKAAITKKDKYIEEVLGQKEGKDLGPGAYETVGRSTTKSFTIKDNIYDRFGALKEVYLLAKDREDRDALTPQETIKPAAKTMDNWNKNNSSSVFKSKSKRVIFTLEQN